MLKMLAESPTARNSMKKKHMRNLNGLGVSFYSTSEMALCILPALVSQVVG